MTTEVVRPGIATMGVAAIASAVATGEVTVAEVAEAMIERIVELDGKVRAFSNFDIETVRAEAAKLTAEAREGTLRGPLHGVPFAVKEQFAVGGLATLGDWKDPSPPVAPEDATVVARLKAAGALLVGKLYMVGPSGVPPTRNPWNLEHTPGGSSSGSGAAVGARFVPFALSEQTAGSGIRPAAYCGVSALKPTYGRNSRYGMFQMAWSHDHACIIATSTADVATVFAVTCGVDPKDPTTVPGGARPIEPLDRPPRIGLVRNHFPALTEPVMQQAVAAAAARLAAAGAEVVDIALPDEFSLAWPNWAVVNGAESTVINMKGDGLREARGQKPGPMPFGATPPKSKWGRAFRGAAPLLPATYYLQAQRIRRWLRDMIDDAIAPFDAVLMATAPGPAPRDLTGSGDWSLLIPWSHVGLPTISIPGGLSPEGLPLGLQFASPSMTDEHLLSVGAWCEGVLGLLPPPTIA